MTKVWITLALVLFGTGLTLFLSYGEEMAYALLLGTVLAFLFVMFAALAYAMPGPTLSWPRRIGVVFGTFLTIAAGILSGGDEGYKYLSTIESFIVTVGFYGGMLLALWAGSSSLRES